MWHDTCASSWGLSTHVCMCLCVSPTSSDLVGLLRRNKKTSWPLGLHLVTVTCSGCGGQKKVIMMIIRGEKFSWKTISCRRIVFLWVLYGMNTDRTWIWMSGWEENVKLEYGFWGESTSEWDKSWVGKGHKELSGVENKYEDTEEKKNREKEDRFNEEALFLE